MSYASCTLNKIDENSLYGVYSADAANLYPSTMSFDNSAFEHKSTIGVIQLDKMSIVTTLGRKTPKNVDVHNQEFIVYNNQELYNKVLEDDLSDEPSNHTVFINSGPAKGIQVTLTKCVLKRSHKTEYYLWFLFGQY